MISTLNKELVSKVLLYFGGAVLVVSVSRCAYNYYNYRNQKQIFEEIEKKINYKKK